MSRTTLVGAALVALVPLTALSVPASAGAESAYDARYAAAYKVTAKINRTTVVAKEDRVVVRGRVTPKAAGQVIVLQQKVEGRSRWVKSGTARIRATGTYVLKDDPSTGGNRQYRVVKPAGNGLAKGISTSMDVTVYAWQKLAQRVRGASEGIAVGPVLVATDTMYPSLHSVSPGSSAFIEYTLGDKCRSLRATYALTDGSATGATGSVELVADGAVRLSEQLTIGHVVRDHVVDLTDVFRIRIAMTSSETPAAYPAVATPEILCR